MPICLAKCSVTFPTNFFSVPVGHDPFNNTDEKTNDDDVYISGTLVSSDPPVSSVLRSPHMAQHDLTIVTRFSWHLELGAAEVRRVTMVMVRTEDTEEGEEPPPPTYNPQVQENPQSVPATSKEFQRKEDDLWSKIFSTS